MHEIHPVLPTLETEVAAHDSHDVCPEAEVYSPFAHSSHELESRLAKVPLGHSSHLVFVESGIEPAGHASHDACPDEVLISPFGQTSHESVEMSA